MNEDTLMIQLARFIEKHSDETLPLTRLAKEAHLSAAHMQKRFKAAIGISPKEYQEACRLKLLKKNLRAGKSATESVYESGHGSPSRVYGKLSQRVGMTPREYKKGGAGLEISCAWATTPLGKVMMAATDRGLCFIQFGKSKAELLAAVAKEFPAAHIAEAKSSAQFDAWVKELNAYLDGSVKQLTLPLDILGTAFQLKVWKFLQQIPRGETVSYTELARKIGQPSAVRAVASACARNNIAVVIPCHRVLRGSGDLAGYRWGLERKRELLKLEKVNSLRGE